MNEGEPDGGEQRRGRYELGPQNNIVNDKKQNWQDGVRVQAVERTRIHWRKELKKGVS